MTQDEFVIVYVALPLAIAIGWLLWRGRYFLRNIIFYALAVAALLAMVRLGHLAWATWDGWAHVDTRPQSYPVCNAEPSWRRDGRSASCWT